MEPLSAWIKFGLRLDINYSVWSLDQDGIPVWDQRYDRTVVVTSEMYAYSVLRPKFHLRTKIISLYQSHPVFYRHYHSPPPWSGGIKRWWRSSICPSVCSVRDLTSRMEAPIKLKVGRKKPWPHSEVERSKVKVTRQINAVAKNQPYLKNGKAYELQTWYMDRVRWPASLTCPETSKITWQWNVTETSKLAGRLSMPRLT